jgi:hypothetical protein
MDILSKDTLTLLRDENLRKAVERVLETGTPSSETVVIRNDDSEEASTQRNSKKVTVRRLST